MAFSSLLRPTACIVTSTPYLNNQTNHSVITKSTKLHTSSTNRPCFPSQYKPLTHDVFGGTGSKRSFLRSATTEPVTSETKTYTTEEQWKIEREALSQQIKDLELKVEQLANDSSSSSPPVGDDIVNDFFNISSKLEQLALTNDGLVIIDPKPNPGACSESIDEMVQNTFKYYDPAGELPAEEKLKYLKGNFGPVSVETPPSDVVVEEGQIPETLKGMMLRNGPNPKFSPEGNYMWMDGDSMIHGIRFKDGKATYVSRYTKTSRFIQHGEFNKSQVMLYGDLHGEYGLFTTCVAMLRTRLNILDKRFGISTANTGLVYHGGRIMALEDFGEPHVLYVTEDGDVETLGMNNYNGKLDHWLSPHPRVDPVTGEMFNIGSLRTTPYCIYRVISKEGVISDPVPITVDVPTYNHEVCITENYVIFQDLPYVYDPEKMKSTEDAWIFNFNDTKKPRYGILPRYATSEDGIKWFEFDESFFVFHNANSWEEDEDTIVLYCCLMEAVTDPITGRSFIAPANFQRFDILIRDFNITIPQLFKITFNLKTNESKKERINSDLSGDWPKINPSYVGRRTQYVYSGEVNGANKIPSIIKYDLKQENGNPKQFVFPTDEFPHTYGGEVVYVPKTEDSTADEDDGYLIAFVHREDEEDSSTGTSYAFVIDAKTMESVAKLRLPARVPYGYHSIFVTEEELQNQIKPST